MAPDGAELVVTRYNADANIGETFKKIIKRAGLTAWPKLIQNLRATRETELIGEYSIQDVASWLGNSAPIAMKHYAMTMQSSFERAIQNGAGVVPGNPPHHTASNGDTQESCDSDSETETPQSAMFPPGDSCRQQSQMPRAGLEPA